MNSVKTVSPVIKWVGGKTQSLPHIVSHIPKKIHNYYELFIGGGSVFMELMNMSNRGDIQISGTMYLNDINPVLIAMYQNIKHDVNRFIQELDILETQYYNSEMTPKPDSRAVIKIDLSHGADHYASQGKSHLYYYYRALYNSNTIDMFTKTVIFVFLNKTCFRGIYREGKNGFNVPFGNYKSPVICNKDNIITLSTNLNSFNTEFTSTDFASVIEPGRLNMYDFVYLDPPYFPVETTSFVAYNNTGFTQHDQLRLKVLCDSLVERKISMIQSNSMCGHIRSLYTGYNITTISSKRRVNSKNPSDTTTEVLIS